MDVPAVRLKAIIEVEIDAGDYFEAAEHQRNLTAYLGEIQCRYPAATIKIKERRGPYRERPVEVREVRMRSGNMKHYG